MKKVIIEEGAWINDFEDDHPLHRITEPMIALRPEEVYLTFALKDPFTKENTWCIVIKLIIEYEHTFRVYPESKVILNPTVLELELKELMRLNDLGGGEY